MWLGEGGLLCLSARHLLVKPSLTTQVRDPSSVPWPASLFHRVCRKPCSGLELRAPGRACALWGGAGDPRTCRGKPFPSPGPDSGAHLAGAALGPWARARRVEEGSLASAA